MELLEKKMLTDKTLSTKWHITTLYNNNKVDKYVVTAIDLAKFINRQRRATRIQRRKVGDKSALKPINPKDSWLVDFTLGKCKEYITHFKMEEAKMMQISIKVID